MATLDDYLVRKKAAVIARRERAEQDPESAGRTLRAAVRVAGRSGIREIRIGDFQIVSDTPENFGGYNLGPPSPDLQLGVLGSCVSHITLIQAAQRGVSLESVRVEVEADMHPLAGRPGFEHIPVYPHNIRYKLFIQSEESEETLRELYEAVEQACPIVNLIKNPQTINGELIINQG